MKFLNLFLSSLTNLQKLLPMPQLIYGTQCYFLIPSWTSYLTKKTHTFQHPLFLWSFPLLKYNNFYSTSTWFSLWLYQSHLLKNFNYLNYTQFQIYLDFNTDAISSVYMKPQIHYLVISSNNQSYFTVNENFLNACYQNGFQTFFHTPRSLFNTNNNPVSETSMFLISQPYKCKIFITFSEYPFLTLFSHSKE